MLKRGYVGTYHRMSPKHLHRYVDEFAGRHNVRESDTIDQMVALVRQSHLARACCKSPLAPKRGNIR